jgi:hypothetical protein
MFKPYFSSKQFTSSTGPTLSGSTLGGVSPVFINSASTELSRTIGVVLTPPFSIAAWVNPASSNTGGCIYCNTNVGFDGWFFYNTSGAPTFQATNGSDAKAFATTNYVQNDWNHVVGVEYSTSSRACFRNGANKGTDSTLMAPVLGASTEEIAGIHGNTNFWIGQIAEIRIYNRALTDAEVWALYDPRSRWDLYWQPNTRAYSFMSAAASAAGYLLVKN